MGHNIESPEEVLAISLGGLGPKVGAENSWHPPHERAPARASMFSIVGSLSSSTSTALATAFCTIGMKFLRLVPVIADGSSSRSCEVLWKSLNLSLKPPETREIISVGDNS